MGATSSSPRSKTLKIAPANSRRGFFQRFAIRRRSQSPVHCYKTASNGTNVAEEEGEENEIDDNVKRIQVESAVADDTTSANGSQDSNLVFKKTESARRKRSWRGRKNVARNEEQKILAPIEEDALISIHDLYNFLNDGSLSPYIHDPSNMLIIDVRDKHSFQKHHVITAKHISMISEQQLTSGYGLAQYMFCIIYDSESNNNNMVTLDVVKVRDRLAHVTPAELFVLRESYDIFYSSFKFLCTDKLIDTAWERKTLLTYPSVIIDDKLYQGRGDQATNDHVVTNLKITHIVNISTEHANRFERKVIYLRLQLEDTSSTNIVRHFEETSDFIQSAIGSGGRVLVHCNLGISRSSAVDLAFLMKYNQWPLDKAYEYLRGRRACANPNRGFLKQLSDWEANVLGERRTNIDYL